MLGSGNEPLPAPSGSSGPEPPSFQWYHYELIGGSCFLLIYKPVSQILRIFHCLQESHPLELLFVLVCLLGRAHWLDNSITSPHNWEDLWG